MTSETTRSHLKDLQQLRKKAHEYVTDYPDLYDMARRAAQAIVYKRTGKRLNPDNVYWHRFSTAVSSPRTFTGWEHFGTPVESMTIVELVIRRFSPQDQVASDELSSWGGFYSVKADHGTFNETCEVPLLAQDVLNDFWALDFSTGYRRKLQHFWSLHGQTFCLLAKADFLAAAGRCLRNRQIPAADFKWLISLMLDENSDTPTLTSLGAVMATGTKAAFHWLDVGGFKARDVLRIVDERGAQILYVPGDSKPFHRFAGPQELYDWLKAQFAAARTRSEMRSHFIRPSAEQTSGAAFDRCIEGLLAHDWHSGQRLVNQIQAPIPGDPFESLRDRARDEMTADAHVLLASNVELRKRLWMGYLDAFLQVTGNLALLGWPVALAVIGASAFNLGLNIDQAVLGKTSAQRKAGVLGCICNALYLAFNLPLVTGLSRAAEGLPDTLATPSLADTLANLNGNQVTLEGVMPVAAEGRLRGVYQRVNGETWIRLSGLFYRVRFNESLGRWQVIDPHNPFAFSAGPLVVLDEHGEWQPLARPGLSGGSPQDVPSAADAQPASLPYGTTGSAFWDHYMLINVYDERSLAEAAIARQEAVMDIFRMEPDEEVVSDSEGEDVHIDLWGAKHRVFRTHDATYQAQSIRRYTHNGGIYNHYLRTGAVFGEGQPTGAFDIAEQVEDIKRFVEDVRTLGFNNDVTLYRGGSGERGTSGQFFRSGQVAVGDVLTNTDITSFSENPYQARTFASSQAGVNAISISAPVSFDDTSVVFELPAGQYLGATPIAPFSSSPREAESIFLPGRYFLIEHLDEVRGAFYRFMRVRIKEVPAPVAGRKLLDMRTGEPFSRERYAARLGAAGKPLVDVFYPQDASVPS
ncbi:dermonecrotic toxin domain-containing protein [Pseudomonas fragariae (ex Marin et al. 2024)]|uniref:dermonecrotic toxin domain-containing protein n=1 Tax=Pseudomonas fragariae (ex Marin et al. 2024) TaxID=3080056 RepID=UPI003F7A1519